MLGYNIYYRAQKGIPLEGPGTGRVGLHLQRTSSGRHAENPQHAWSMLVCNKPTPRIPEDETNMRILPGGSLKKSLPVRSLRLCAERRVLNAITGLIPANLNLRSLYALQDTGANVVGVSICVWTVVEDHRQFLELLCHTETGRPCLSLNSRATKPLSIRNARKHLTLAM